METRGIRWNGSGILDREQVCGVSNGGVPPDLSRVETQHNYTIGTYRYDSSPEVAPASCTVQPSKRKKPLIETVTTTNAKKDVFVYFISHLHKNVRRKIKHDGTQKNNGSERAVADLVVLGNSAHVAHTMCCCATNFGSRKSWKGSARGGCIIVWSMLVTCYVEWVLPGSRDIVSDLVWNQVLNSAYFILPGLNSASYAQQ
ncbi:hypothetical protein CBL_07132 [Carabus blaptoides fortunei]